MDKIELLVLKNLIYNEDFARKVLPFLKQEYFQDSIQQVLYQEIKSFIDNYNKLPSNDSLEIELSINSASELG